MQPDTRTSRNLWQTLAPNGRAKMKDYVICFIKISEILKRDCRIPGGSIDAVYKIKSDETDDARSEAIKLFSEDNPDENVDDYITSIGWLS